MPKVSIIISNRNDVAMLIVTIRSCIEALKPLGPNAGEIVIVDNSDKAVYEKLQAALPTGYCRDKTLKVFYQPFPCLFTARDTAAQRATGEYILCVDGHMLIGHNMVVDLVSFMDSRQSDQLLGFAHAPINWAHQHESRSRHDRDMSQHELGSWGAAYTTPRMITWKGMPWICRREWFINQLNGYGALSQHRISWGGGDMHIGVKPWLLGYQNWAVPTSPGIHIGPFPRTDSDPKNKNIVRASHTNDNIDDYRYRVWAKSGNGPHSVGFLVSCYVLGGEAMMLRNKSALIERFGKFIDVNKWWDQAKEWGKDEKAWLDKRKKMTFEELLLNKPWQVDAEQHIPAAQYNASQSKAA